MSVLLYCSMCALYTGWMSTKRVTTMVWQK